MSTNAIRNIMQSVQDRETIVTCPDVLVYLENTPYKNNYFIPSGGSPYTVVSFNDHVSNFQVGYDVDNLTPPCSITLVVPAQDKYLYMTPGGNNLIESMMSVKVYAKGYYPSKNGTTTSSDGITVKNTVYYRVFNGVTTHIGHTDTGATLTISIQCMGVLQFLNFIYQDINPALCSNSPYGATSSTTRFGNMNPYDQLAAVFAEAITFDGFQLNALKNTSTQSAANNDQFTQAVLRGYINKWTGILLGVIKDTRILGNTLRPGVNTSGSTSNLPSNPLPTTREGLAQLTEALTNADSALLASHGDGFKPTSPTDPIYVYGGADADPTLQALRAYQPSYGVGDIALPNGNIVSRIDRIRTLVQIIGFEGYQDVDGMIIFKPPLYNLDVTNIGTEASPSGANTPVDNITQDNNPFVVHLSEIESESETEDQQAIQVTRMNVQSSFTSNPLLPSGGPLLPIVTHVDIPKLTRFGLREQPAVPIPWIVREDKFLLYSYAVAEMARKNRGFRTYTITIPMRPELRLGFPMYIPHKDMYGYIKTININYQQGATATMSITMDSIRKRPMFTSVSTDEKGNAVQILTTQPNLVMQYATDASESARTTTPSYVKPATNNALYSTMPTTSNTYISGSTDPNNLSGAPGTLPQAQQSLLSPSQQAVIDYGKKNMGTSWTTEYDTDIKCFQPQPDNVLPADITYQDDSGATHTSKTASGVTLEAGSPFFSQQNWAAGLNNTFFHRILTSQPLTDEKGYEVITPYPWGRWRSLKKAYYETRAGIILDANQTSGLLSFESNSPNDSKGAPRSTSTPTTTSNYANPEGTAVLTGVNAFLFAGVSNPVSLEAGAQLISALATNSQTAVENTSFELSDNTPISPTPPLPAPTPVTPAFDYSSQVSTSSQPKSPLGVFFTGGTSPSNAMMTELTTTLSENGTVINNAPVANLLGIPVIPTNNSPSSAPNANVSSVISGS